MQVHQPQWRFFGSRRFWALAGALVLVLVFVLGPRWLRLHAESGTTVPVVALSGPPHATPGQKVRFGVLVRSGAGAPLAGVPVRVGFWRSGFRELGRGVTADGGDAALDVTMPADFGERRGVVAFADGELARASDQIFVEPAKLGKPSMVVTTDKPLYQPGQTIHIRALAMAGTVPLAGAPAEITVRVDRTKVFHRSTTTSPFGVVAADFPLADQVKLGPYSVEVTAGSGLDTVEEVATVTVKHYALPRMKVALEDVTPLTPRTPLRGKVRATWIFGEPVPRARVLVAATRNQGVREGSIAGTTGADGTFAFEIEPRNGDWGGDSTSAYEISAEVTLATLTARTTAPITGLAGGGVALEAFPESGVVVDGVEQDVFVVVTKGKKEGVEIALERGEGPGVRTNEHGVAKLRVHPRPRPRSAPAWETEPPIAIVARGLETVGGTLSVPVEIDRLVVRPDKDYYRAGETARIRLLGVPAGDRALVRMTKGEQPIGMGSCRATDGTAGCEVAMPLPAGLSGLAWVHAMAVPEGGGRARHGKRIIVAGGGDRDLALAVKPDKPVHAPRETGSLDIAVTGVGGAPVKASLGLAVADEAVFALADVRPDLEKVFFTIDRDIAASRQSSRFGNRDTSHGLPSSFEPSAAFDTATAEDLRSVVLASLTTMPETGGLRDERDLASRTQDTVLGGKRRVEAWALLSVLLLSLASFGGFLAFGWVRLRGAPYLPVFEGEGPRFADEARSFVFDVLVALVAPLLFALGDAVLSRWLLDRSSDAVVFGAWMTIAILVSALLLRAVGRVNRTAVARATAFGRAVAFLPAAVLLGQIGIALVIVDNGERVTNFLGDRHDFGPLALAVLLAAQISFGMLSVSAHSLQRALTPRRRIWLLLSRASLLGLPFTIAAIGLFTHYYRQDLMSADWVSYRSERDRAVEAEQYEPLPSTNADNKEGGTGTRAKGEEGSMGNPNVRPSGGSGGARYGVMGPSDNAKRREVPQVRVRDWFPETLLWAPEVLTDDAGHANVKVPFADSITTWRLGLKAVSQTGQLGSLAVPLVVKQEFFVDLVTPPLLTQGDEIAIPVGVHGYEERAQEVTLVLEGEGFSTVGPATMAVSLGPHDSRVARFRVRADAAGERVLRVRAAGASRADALERKILVVPNGREVRRTVDGRVTGSATSTVELPTGAIEGGNDLWVKVYGGPLSQVGEGLDGVFQMPHGCFEQTSSTTYPSVMALDFLKRSKAVSPEVQRKAEGYILEGYQRILSFEISGGGFSLYGRPPASPALSAYGLLELADMSRVGHVDAEVLRRTRAYLHRARVENEAARKDPLLAAYVAWALAATAEALPNEKDEALAPVLDEVARAAGSVAADPYALALRANALLAGGRRADPLLADLARLAVRGEDGVHWSSTLRGVFHSAGPSLDVEVTGLASHALARAGLEPELRNGALSWLVARRSSYGTWSTTQATVAAMRALLDEAKPAPKDAQDITILADGASVETFRLEPAARDVHRLIDLRKHASTGPHAIEVRATGAGDVAYQVVARHWLPRQKQPGAALALDVAYETTSLAVATSTRARVKLAWDGKEPARMPLVEIGTAPGFEVDTAGLDRLVSANGPIQRYSVAPGKVTIYFGDVDREKPVSFEIGMQALHPAKVVAPASVAYLYYEPEVRVETTPVVLRVL